MKDAVKEAALFKAEGAKMCMPVAIRDYTDFYSSKNHAYNVGVMFRGPDNALQPNWLHLPVGYHGDNVGVLMSESELDGLLGEISGPCTYDNMVKMFQEKMAGEGNDPDDLIVQAFK